MASATIKSASTKCCLVLQQSLNDIYGPSAPAGFIGDLTGFLDSLVSDYNTNGFERIDTSAFPGKARPVDGKFPKIEIMFEKPFTGTVVDVAASVKGLCDDQTGDTDPYGYMDVTVNKVVQIGGSFTKADFAELCEGPSERLALRLRRAAALLREAMDKELIQEAYTRLGKYSDGTASTEPGTGSTAKALPILNSSGQINPGALGTLRAEFSRQLDMRPPILVGGHILSTWNYALRAAGVGANNVDGSQLDLTLGSQFFVDQFIDAEIDKLEGNKSSRGIAYSPGQFQLLEWYQNTGDFEELDKDDYTETTITIDGITYDYTLRYDECDHKWTWTLTKWFDLFCIPNAVYGGVYDFNRKLLINLTCGDFTCDDYWGQTEVEAASP